MSLCFSEVFFSSTQTQANSCCQKKKRTRSSITMHAAIINFINTKLFTLYHGEKTSFRYKENFVISLMLLELILFLHQVTKLVSH